MDAMTLGEKLVAVADALEVQKRNLAGLEDQIVERRANLAIVRAELLAHVGEMIRTSGELLVLADRNAAAIIRDRSMSPDEQAHLGSLLQAAGAQLYSVGGIIKGVPATSE